jgi:hypothetical protein
VRAAASDQTLTGQAAKAAKLVAFPVARARLELAGATVSREIERDAKLPLRRIRKSPQGAVFASRAVALIEARVRAVVLNATLPRLAL